MEQNNSLLMKSAVAVEAESLPPGRAAAAERFEKSRKAPNLERDLGLDFVKGFLVIVMVAYHVTDYFVTGGMSTTGAPALLYRYLHFVSGAFIFTTGYVVAEYYKHKYFLDKWKTSRRLVNRGLKLIGIFSLANLLINFLQLHNFNNTQFGPKFFLENLVPIFVYGAGKLSSFEVLLPIGYLLVVSPLLLVAYARFRRYEMALILAAILGCTAFGVRVTGPSLVILGFAGFMIGTFARTVTAAPLWSEALNAGVLFAYLVAIQRIPQNFLTYTLNIVIILKFVHDVSRRINLQTAVTRPLVLFGQYSLFCYFAQIIFLQFLYRFVFHRHWPLGYQVLLVGLAACAALVAGCLVLERLRAKSRIVNSVYKFVFA